MEAYKEGGILLEENRQKHLDAPSRSQQSPQLTEMGSIKGLWANLEQFVKMC